MRVQTTRERLLDAAYRIISEESLSCLSIDRVAMRADLSRRTFFLHFDSKDQLLAEVLEYVRPAFAEMYEDWSRQLDPGLVVEERIEALLRHFIEIASNPRWKGCCFLRVSAEFGDRTGHPVHAVVAAAHRDMERWLEAELGKGGYVAPALMAKQLVMLLNGMLVMQLVHRNGTYGTALLRMLPDILASGRPGGRDAHIPPSSWAPAV